MWYLALYILIGLILILVFQVSIRWFQHGELDFDDIAMSILGGVFWPGALAAIALACTIFAFTEGYVTLSKKIYKKLKES